MCELGAGDLLVKRTRMLVGKFELNPERRPIWAWLLERYHSFATTEKVIVKPSVNNGNG